MTRLAGLHAVAMMLAVGTPALAAADAPTVASLEVTDGGAAYEVLLRGNGTLGAERVRSNEGLLRVWLSGFDDAARLVARGDGARVRRVEVRPGVDQTLLVSIELARGTRVPARAVTVERSDGLTRIAIDAGALPPPAPEISPAAPPAGTPVAAEDAPPLTSPAAPPAGTPVAAEPIQPPPTRGHAGASPPDDGTDASAAEAPPAARFPWEEPEDEDDGAERAGAVEPTEELALGTTDAGATTGTLALLTLFLGLVYVGVRTLQSRNLRVPGSDPTIALVASRRLGPKHQLVVVRAMGRDHLLSVQGSQTKRLASMRSPDPDDFEASFGIPDAGVDLAPPSRTSPPDLDAPERSSAPPPGRAGEAARSAIAGLRYPTWSTFVRRPASDPPAARRSSAAPRRDDDEEIESRFGSRLFDYALDAQRRADDARRPRDDDDDGTEPSEAIAGLLRLRARRRTSAG